MSRTWPALDPRVERTIQPTNAGFDLFLARLKAYISKHGGETRFEVVLIGHSMGAIVLNEILRQAGNGTDPQLAVPTLPVSEIVYMGAACSIKDYEDTVFPYLRHHPQTTLHHLVLHSTAEVRDRVGQVR